MGVTIKVSPRVRLVIDGGSDEVLSNKHERFTVEQLGLAMVGADHVRYWRDRMGLHKNVYDRVRAGEAIPGWQLTPTLEALRWRDENEASSVLHAHGLDPTRVMTPREVLRAHGDAARRFIDTLAVHPAGEPMLMPSTFRGTLLNDDSDPNEPVTCVDY